MSADEFLTMVRSTYPGFPEIADLSPVAFAPGRIGDDDVDLNQDHRIEVAITLCRNFTSADRQLARFLLEQEIESHKLAPGYSDDLKICAFPLFALGHPEDVLLLWKAKTVSFDTFCGFDIQLLVGAGVEQTLMFLHSEGSDAARRATEYIKDCQLAGDFDHIEEYRKHGREWLLEYYDQS